MQCIVVTPETTLREGPADFVALTLFDGEVGIGPGHTPLIGRLGFGEMRIRNGAQLDRYYVEGGFVEVADDVVSVLTARAVPAAEVDPGAAREQMVAVQAKPAHSPELLELRERAVAQGRAQLRVARKSHGGAAHS